MKKRNYIFLLFLPLLVYFLSTCKKYPEDKFISLQSTKNRLSAEWKITKVEVNGEDVTWKYNDSLKTTAITDYYIWIYCDYVYGNKSRGDVADLYAINTSSKDIQSAVEKADIGLAGFQIERKPKQIAFTPRSTVRRTVTKDSVAKRILIDGLFCGYGLGIGKNIWNMRKLYNGHFIIERNNGSSLFRMTLKKSKR
jgi:hypothetical protein